VDIYFASTMADQVRGWIYGGWKKSGTHTTEWINKTQDFINRAFSVRLDEGVKCPPVEPHEDNRVVIVPSGDT
jgi:hypothetical protein